MNVSYHIPGGLIFGVICALVADSKGRSALGWFILGFFLSCIALVLLLVLPDEGEQAHAKKKDARERQRLREMVRKDREATDRRFEETARRLDTHDHAIGLDTRNPVPVELTEEDIANIGAGAAPPPVPTALSVHQSPWFYLEDTDDSEDRIQRGPVSVPTLRGLFDDGMVNGTTLVWREGMADWAAIDQLHDLSEALRAG